MKGKVPAGAMGGWLATYMRTSSSPTALCIFGESRRGLGCWAIPERSHRLGCGSAASMWEGARWVFHQLLRCDNQFLLL